MRSLVQTEPPKNDPLVSRVVWARSPKQAGDVEYVRLGVHHLTTRKMVESGRLAAIGEYCGLIHGEGLLAAPAGIFQGLKRPLSAPGMDGRVYAYITVPHTNFTYSGENRHEGSWLRNAALPSRSVFVVFVSFGKDVVSDVAESLGPADSEIGGAILYWEWTLADDIETRLPIGYKDRYRRMVWRENRP
jgi:hypothetical protein